MLAIPTGRRFVKAFVWLVPVAVVLAAGAYYWAMQKPAQGQSTQSANAQVAPAPAPKEVDFAAPVQLKIPSINVEAPIDQMGLTKDGDMDAPSGAHNVGWYKLGPHPGDKGSAVIAGHYGRWKNGDASVFDDLNKLVAGDRILVQDENGATAIFVVRESKMLDKNDNASAVFASSDDKAHLNLITCQGAWSEEQKTYSSRLVVFADKVAE